MGKGKRAKRPPVDWDKVPVVIVGTPNPDALRAIVQSIREFEIAQLIKKQAEQAGQQKTADDVVERGSISS